MEVGDLVRIRGLVSKPEHNGKSGRIITLDEGSGRHVVRLRDDDGTMLSLKPANISPLTQAIHDDEVEDVSTDSMANAQQHRAQEQQREQREQQQQQRESAAAAPQFMRQTPPPPQSQPAVPSFIRERMAEHEASMDWNALDSSSEEEQPAADISASHDLMTLTLVKMGKLGMRITESSRSDERGHAVIDSVAEGPASAAGVQPRDLILSVNNAQIQGGRADATAKIASAPFGVMTLGIGRRRQRAGGTTADSTQPLPPRAVPFGCDDVD